MMVGNKRRIGALVLPEEMMVEVFLRLPIKSILRFRTVCQSWDAVLSSEEFCGLHMAKAEVASSVLPKLFFTSPTAGFDATAVYLSSSSGPDDGLLFTLDGIRSDFVNMMPAPCRGLTLIHEHGIVAPAYYVFNASTRAVTRLPPCQAAVSLSVTAGLGFDAQTKKYKVVRLFYGNYRDKQRVKCEIYTLGGVHGDCWKPAVGGVPFKFCRAAGAAISHANRDKLLPVFANGFLHWLLHPLFLAERPRAAILSFSVTDETFAFVRSPPFVVSGVHLVELAGRLCVVRDLRNVSFNCSTLEIWKLNDYSSGSWSLEHRIDLLQHVARDLIEPQVVKIIGSVGNCGSVKKIVIATSKRKVVVYDPMCQTLETVIAIREETHSSYQMEQSALRVSLFQESLVPVHQTNEEIALSAPLAKAAREILLRLPGDCTVQFKLVCKQWLRLIENNSFMRSYYLHKNMDRKPKIMLVGKGTGGSGFSFTPLKLLRHVPNRDIWLNTKVVGSKPCLGMNMLSTELKDYLYNPCTGFCRVYHARGPFAHIPWNIPSYDCIPEDHAFAVGCKNVGLGFNLSMQEHVIVEIYYHLKDYKSRQYVLTCTISTCERGSVQSSLQPPLPVSDMQPTYLAGALYWMSDPRLGQNYERAIVSFDIATSTFDVIPCPSCIAMWNNRSSSDAFVVELEGTLCAVLANPDAEELNIWKREHDQWNRAYIVYLKGWPGYSLGTNVVMPWAVDPKDGKILLNTGRKLGFYDPARRSIENLYDVEELLRVRSTEKSSRGGVPEKTHIPKYKHYVEKLCTQQSPFEQHNSSDDTSSSLSGTRGERYLERRNSLYAEIIPLVPILYEESLASYPRPKARCLQ
ncbi:unnamed protein product [Urochloa decumbens]|uniref:F-box domain-containing protein n=1 Tax=Urochloa decumbens TaxID=240449 RepID=A0ABC8WGM6_9POAL